ncbi:MAG TPA: GNAT family N-acetyltransferase [Candidatus Binatia bacterium]|nr:GNAT family N-acetyltransferase [Candidatus Binatia bacterium]
MLRRLADGTVVAIGHLGPGDGPRIRAGFERLSPTSRYRRFFTPIPRLSEPMLARLTAIDGWRHVAIGAETVPAFGGHPIEAGVARFHRLDGRADAAEVAVTVVDELQRRGLGRILLEEIASAARERGIRSLVANVLPENEPMLRLIRRIDPDAVAHLEDGLYVYEISLVRGVRLWTPRRAA